MKEEWIKDIGGLKARKPAKGLRLRLRLARRTVVAATLFTLFDRAHALSSFLLLQLACLCT
jgi:hypothetical protein